MTEEIPNDDPASSSPREPTPSSAKPKDNAPATNWVRVFTACTVPLWGYYLLVLVSGRTILGYQMRLRRLSFLFVAGIIVTYLLCWVLLKRQWLSAKSLKALTAAAISLSLSTVVADCISYFYLTRTQPGPEYFDQQRLTDRQLWEGEFAPRVYYPTERNFQLLKPNVHVEANIYGDRYYPGLLNFPTVVKNVLQLRTISFSIDENGFRETTPLKQAQIFALGDSFTFGGGTTQEKIWTKVLEKAINEPVYNLGVSGSSPKQELLLLEYLLQSKADSLNIKHLIWVIYEGNDLDDEYDEVNPYSRHPSLSSRISSVVSKIEEYSAIRRLLVALRASSNPEAYKVDGGTLTIPLYHSKRFGYRLFNQTYIQQASRTFEGLMSHPNRVLLDQTFAQMAALSSARGFDVTVAIAPSDARLCAPYFENFPRISDQPYFINHIVDLSMKHGFKVIDLYQLMQPYAKEELLHWRDDGHWNEEGNKVVGEIIAKHFRDGAIKTASSFPAK